MFLCLLLENPFTYEWSFVSAPIGHPGVMEGKRKRTVKISEVRLHTRNPGFCNYMLMLAL